MKKYTIGTGVKPEDVLSYDHEGGVLLFEVKGEFLPLDEEIVKQLSRENQLRYHGAKEFHDNWRGEDHEKFVEQFSVDKNLSGSATDKLNVKDTKDLHFRWARPDRVSSYLAMGYRLAGPDEVQTFLGPSGNKHEISVLGKQELVLLCIPKSQFEKKMQEKVKKNKEMAGLLQKQTASSLKGEGGFVASEKDGHQWTEIPNKEE